MDNNVDTAAVQIENNTKYSMSTVVNLALADQYLLDKDVTFNITEKSSEVYVRCALKFTCTSGAEVAKDMIKFQDYKLGTNAGYSWQQFGEYFYLCDETGIPKTIERSQAGQIFTFVEKENLLLPHDAIVGKHFTTADQVTMTVEIEAIQGRNLEDSSIFELNQYFLTEIPSNTYTVKFHEADGTILSEQANIAYGSNAIVPEIEKEKAADHTTFAYWSTTEDGDGLKIREADETRIFSNISQNMEVWPVYAHDQVKIDVTYGNGGQITPGSTTIDWGTGKTFRVVADSGHAIQQIKRDGVVIYDFSGSKIDMFDYVLENVVADTQIEATFEPVTYEIIVITVGNGTVEPGTTTAVYGSSKAFTMTPDEGYRIWSITLDGVEIPVTASSGNAQRYTISNINSDHILSVKFVTSVLKITTVAGANGTIRPNELEVEYDSFASVSIVPNEGYEISSIYIDGVKVDDSKVAKGGVAQNISFEHVTEDHEVRATFSRIKLTITASAGEGGLISPKGEIGCDYGATVSFDIIPDALKTIDKIYVDGAEVAVTVTEGDKQTYVFENLKESHTIHATFKRSYIRLDINGGSGSQPSISYSLDGTKFTLSNVEPKGPGGKEFYYYSTRAFDNEKGQLGDRYDLGFEYDIPDLENTTTLYAIYLEPTPDLSVYSSYMVFPKGTKNIQRLGFEEALKEAQNVEGFGQIIAVLLSLVFSTSQQDNNLVYCTLPAGLNSLDYYAFSGCLSLTGVSVPASLSIINQMAFSNTQSLKSFTVPYSCTSIGSNVFENSGLEEIKLNKKLQSIGSSAFKGSGLRYFKAQSSITSMGKVNLLYSDSKADFTNDVFQSCSNLEEIDFSEQTTFLGQTFQDCSALKSVIMPGRITTIPESEFRNCISLTQISYKNGDTIVNKFPSTLKTIEQYAFYGCALSDMMLDECSKVSIGDYAFAANKFGSLTIQSSQIADVGKFAFSSSNNLTSVDWQIEKNVPEFCFAYSSNLKEFKTKSIKGGIADYAFVDCISLGSVDLKISGTDFVIATAAFKNCAITSNNFIPEGVINIESQAFYGNPFQSLIFPESLLMLSENALQNCLNLEKFELKKELSSIISNLNMIGPTSTWYVEGEPYAVGTELSSAPDGIGPAFVYTIYPGKASNVDWEWIEVISNTQIKRYTTSIDSNGNKTTVSTIETKNYAGTEVGKKYLTKYIPSEIASGTLNIVAPSALIDYNGNVHDMEGIISFDVNDIAAEKIANDSVYLEIVSGLILIGDNCFNNTNGKGLADITVPMTIKFIGVNAFEGTKISSVHLPELEYVGTYAFAGCSNLTAAEFSNLITQIPDGCFQNSGLTKFVMPQFLTKIGDAAFYSSKITKLSFPATLSGVGTSAFANCLNLTFIEGLSNTKITEIKTQTFYNCLNLDKVYLPSTTKVIGDSAFANCSRLINLTLGSSLENIKASAFLACSALTSIEFPETLKQIETKAFDSCSRLAIITFKHADMSNIDVAASVFNGTTSALKVYIQSNIQLADFKAKFDGTTTDRGFAEDATLFYQNKTNPLAYYKSKEWIQVFQVIVYCGDGGSAIIKFGDGPEQLIQSLKTKTFDVINGTSYTLQMKPGPDKMFMSLSINGVITTGDNKVGNKTYPTDGVAIISEDTKIIIAFNTPLVILDPNGGSANHVASEAEDKQSFTIMVPDSENEDDYKKGDMDFYFYSTNYLDNKASQTGKRFDVGVRYSIADLGEIKKLYAIYLKPTDVDYNFNDGIISLTKKNISITDLVIPKKINGQEVTGIADLGFSRCGTSGKIQGNSIITGIITMPSTMKSIGIRAFAGNTGISNQFSFPFNLETLGDEVFALCHFKSVNINKLVSSSNVIRFANNILYTRDSATNLEKIYQFALGSGVSEINRLDAQIIATHAFAGSSIESFDDSNIIKTYGEYSFADCNLLKNVTLQQKPTSVTFANNLFDGTAASLSIFVPNSPADGYISQWADSNKDDRLGWHNGVFIYESASNSSSIPYAQIANKHWYKIYKVIAKNEKGGEQISIINKSTISTNGTLTNSFENYKKYFGSGTAYKDYFREDWELEIQVVPDSKNGYILKRLTYKENGGNEIDIPLDQKNFKGSTYSHTIPGETRKGDWEVTAYFEIRNQNISIYVDSGIQKSSLSNFSGPTDATFDGKAYSLYTTSLLYNRSFSLNNSPISSYAIISFKYAETTDDEGSPIDRENWIWKYVSVKSTSIGRYSTSSFNNVTQKFANVTHDYVIVVDTVYAPIVLHLSDHYTPNGMRYDEDVNQYVKIDGVNLIQKGFTTFTIPEAYDDEKFNSMELYYFMNNTKRFDTGFTYSAELLSKNGQSSYYVLEGKYFAVISTDYYDTGKSGIFQLKKEFNKIAYAIPKTINGKTTTTIASNLSLGQQYYQGTVLTLPKTVTSIEFGAFAMSKLASPIYFPTGLANIAEGGLTTTSSATFLQTRVASVSYMFEIGENNEYLTSSNKKTLITANSNIGTTNIPASVTKLGAYLFAERGDISVYSDEYNEKAVKVYGYGVFFNTNMTELTFTNASQDVSFDGLLLNASRKIVAYVADDGYMSKLQNVGFWACEKIDNHDINPFSSMYVTKTSATSGQNPDVTDNCVSLYAIYRYNKVQNKNEWQRVYFYTHDPDNALFEFVSHNQGNEFKDPDKDTNKIYIADGVLSYSISLKVNQRTIKSITHHAYIDFTTIDQESYYEWNGDLTKSIKETDVFEMNLEKSTHISITTTPTEYTIVVEFVGNDSGLDSTVLAAVDMTELNSSTTKEKELFGIKVDADGKNIESNKITKEWNKYIISGAPYGSSIYITLTNNITNDYAKSVFIIVGHSGQSTPFGDDFVGTRMQYAFDSFLVDGNKTISAFVAVRPISIDVNGGQGTAPGYTTSVYANSEGMYGFNIDDSSKADLLRKGNAELYYFSSEKEAVDFSDQRYDISNTYMFFLDRLLSSSATRSTLYARYAEYSTENWTMNQSSLVSYSGTGASGIFYGSEGCDSTNFVVVPKKINYTVVKGLQDNALSQLSNSVSYILFPGGEFKKIGSTMLGTSNAVTKIQFPSGISEISPATFRNASELTDFILNDSVESVYTTSEGILYKTIDKSIGTATLVSILCAHPRQKEVSYETINYSVSIIWAYAFYGCDQGTAELEFPNVSTIGESAFKNADALKSIKFGGALQEIPQYCFESCSNLVSVGRVLYDELGRLDYGANIGESAFKNCSSLASISQLKNVGVSAFENCTSLSSIGFYSDANGLEISENGFLNSGLETVDLSNVATVGVSAFESCHSLTSVTLSQEMTTVNESCFLDCALTTITIPNSVSKIGKAAFRHNIGMKSIVFEPSTIEIASDAFYDSDSETKQIGITTIQLKNNFTTAYDLSNIRVPGIGFWRYSKDSSIANSTTEADKLLNAGYYFWVEGSVFVQKSNAGPQWFKTLSDAFDYAKGSTANVQVWRNQSITKSIALSTASTDIKLYSAPYQCVVSRAAANCYFFQISAGSKLELTKKDDTASLVLDGAKDTYKANTSTVVYISQGEFIMSGGTIQDNRASNGGAVYIAKNQSFTMTGGTIQDCIGANSAGAIYVDEGASTKFIMTGGTIDGCKAKNLDGGAIYVSPLAEVHLNGGVIQNCKANNSGGALYIDQTSKVWMSGATIKKCNALTLYGGAIYNNGTFEMNDPNSQIISSGSSLDDNCSAKEAGGAIYNNESGTLTLSAGVIKGAVSLKKLGGAIYSSGEVTISGDVSISGTSFGYGGGLYIASGTVTMTGGTIENSKGTQGGGGVMVANGIFNFRGGKISHCSSGNSYGGGIYINKGRLTINTGGTIDSCSASYGGGVATTGSAVFNMLSGTISNNKATKNGGGIWCDTAGWTGSAADAKMTGGTISGNTAQYGGGVFVCGDKLLSIWGGKISNNTADKNGGGIYVDQWGELYLSHDSATTSHPTISSNIAQNGGGLYWAGYGKFYSWNGTEILNNIANENGGGVYAMHALDNDGRAFASAGGRKNVIVSWSLCDTNLNNNDAQNGGGLYFTNSDVVLTRVNSAENSSSSGKESGLIYMHHSWIDLRGQCRMSGTIRFVEVGNWVYTNRRFDGWYSLTVKGGWNNSGQKINIIQDSFETKVGNSTQRFYFLCGWDIAPVAKQVFIPYYNNLEDIIWSTDNTYGARAHLYSTI